MSVDNVCAKKGFKNKEHHTAPVPMSRYHARTQPSQRVVSVGDEISSCLPVDNSVAGIWKGHLKDPSVHFFSM